LMPPLSGILNTPKPIMTGACCGCARVTIAQHSSILTVPFSLQDQAGAIEDAQRALTYFQKQRREQDRQNAQLLITMITAPLVLP
jgi:hypothetical protein